MLGLLRLVFLNQYPQFYIPHAHLGKCFLIFIAREYTRTQKTQRRQRKKNNFLKSPLPLFQVFYFLLCVLCALYVFLCAKNF